jgi:hypothetical protein
VGDDAYARDQLHRSEEAALPLAFRLMAGRLLEHIDGACRERLIDLEELAAVDRGGDHKDGRRAMRHDVLGGGEAAHDRQHHVHGDDVWSGPLANLDRGPAVLGLSDELQGRIGAYDLQEPLAHRR